MKRFLLLGLIAVLAQANVQTEVTAVNEGSVSIKPVQGLVEGESAYVTREYDADHATVIAECTVTDTVAGTMVCRPFEHLYHESLTMVGDAVKAGDRVYSGIMNDSIAIIAPSQPLYLMVKEARKGSMVFHPDIFAAKLKYDDNPAPDKEAFKSFCRQNFIGLLVFVLNDGIYDVDCNSFNVIAKAPGSYSDKENDKPFYHRVGEIERGFFDFSDEEVTDFSAYYKSMIGVK